MITPSFSLTATERVLPNLALDFTTASLDARVTFTRSGDTATVVDSSGYIVGINANLPRFDFDPVTLFCNGLLIEEARTNIATYSEQFDNPVWQNFETSESANTVNSPANTLTADKIIDTNVSAVHRIKQDFTSAGTTYSMSVFAKTAEYNRFTIRALPSGNYATFDTNLGTVVASSGGTGTIVQSGNGFYRCSFVSTESAGAASFNIILNTNTGSGNQVFTGTGSFGVYIWGAQLEAGAFPTSYIPTTTTAVTRNADVATMTGTNFSDWYNPTEGSFVVTLNQFGLATGTNAQAAIAVDDGTTGNRNWLYARSTGDVGQNIISSGGSTISNILSSATISIDTNFTHAISYKTNKFVYSLNAVQNGIDTAGNVPVSPTQMYIGSRSGNLAYLNGHINRIMYYPQSLTNAELLAFSK